MYFSMEILCSCYRNCNQIFRLELTSHHQWYDWEKGRKGGRRERGKKRKKTIRPERDKSLIPPLCTARVHSSLRIGFQASVLA